MHRPAGRVGASALDRTSLVSVSTPVSNRWLDVLPLPLGVIRDGCFTYVNDALVSLLATTRERMVGRSFFEPVVPEDRERIRERHRARLSTEPVPDSYEFSVLRDDGERRAVRIFVARSGEDVIFQLHDVTERAARESKLLGLSRLGASVRALHGTDGIWDGVITGLCVLGCTAVHLIVRGELLVPASSSLPDGLDVLLPREARSSPCGSRHAWGAAVDHAFDDGSAFLDDLPLALQQLMGTDDSAGVRERIKASGLERGVLLRVGASAIPRELLLVGAGWLATEDLPSWTVFGAQLTAALESARVIADASRRNAELAILNRLATESGLATNLKALFEVGAREIISTFGYIAVAIYLIDPGGETATLH
jgi:PAS domain S-box-containing protein